MTRRVPIALALLIVAATSLAAHDLFLKPAEFFVAPHSELRIRVLNGTFTSSENAVTANRLRELSVVTPAGVTHPDTTSWSASGDTSILTLRTGDPGTYVIGVSVLPRELGLEAAQFNRYLASDGIPDVLAARRREGEMERPARERYSKHVKAVVQVGSERSAAYATALGHPAELIPLDNPYGMRPGGVLRVRAMVDGESVARQLVVAGGLTRRGARIAPRSVRTDAQGVARIPLASPGQWYVKFIRMTRLRGDSADYESKWATLTFEVR